MRKRYNNQLAIASVLVAISLASSLEVDAKAFVANTSVVSFDDAKIHYDVNIKRTMQEEAPNQDTWVSLQVPTKQSSFKAQESFTVFKNPNTMQYKMQHDGKAWTDKDGFRRYGDEGYYMVAMGSYYTPKCGTILRITFDTGNTIMVISGDQKANIHTDSKNQKALNDSILEFIVDLNKISETCRIRGDMSFAAGNNLKGHITSIERLG